MWRQNKKSRHLEFRGGTLKWFQTTNSLSTPLFSQVRAEAAAKSIFVAGIHSVSARRSVFACVNNFCEYVGIIHGEISHYFPVEVNVRSAKRSDQLRVRSAVQAGRSIDSGNPEPTELTFTLSTITIGILKCFVDCVFGNRINRTAASPETFRSLKNAAAAVPGRYSIFCAWHCSLVFFSLADKKSLSYRVAIILFTRAKSALSTSVVPRSLRLRLGDFFVRIWLVNAFLRFTFPDAVVLKRFFAPLFDFILGITAPESISGKMVSP